MNKFSEKILENNNIQDKNKLLIIRGLPGSGKSTFADFLCSIIPNAKRFETDDYWYDKDGNYNFDFSKIGLAHKDNENKVEQAMIDKVPYIIVSNTSTKESEVNTYIKLAQKYDYDYNVITKENWLGTKNIHNVDDKTLSKMANNLKNSIKLL